MASFRKRNGKWQVQVRRVGSAPLSRTFLSKQDGITWARIQEHGIDVGDLPILKGSKTHTLGDILDRYEREVIPYKRANSTEAYMLNVIRRHPMSAKPLGNLSAEDVADFRDKRLQTSKPATVLRNLRVLKHALKIARAEWGLAAPVSEIEKVRMPQVAMRHIDRVSDPAIAKLLEVARGQASQLLVLAVKLAVTTGMRRGEILALKWTDVDFLEARLLIRMSKNGRPRMIPLAPDAMAILRGEIPVSEQVVPASYNSIKLAFGRARRKAGTTFRFHDLRHEAISRFFELGLTIPEVQMISGHRTLSQLSRYSHPDVQRLAEKLNGCGT